MNNIINQDHDFLNQTTQQVQFYKVQGSIRRFMSDRPMFYSACPECKKKVMPNDLAQGFFCEKCSKSFEDCNPTYNFSMRVGDFTSAQSVSILGEGGDDIMGIKASVVKQICDESRFDPASGMPAPPHFKQMIDSRQMKRATMILRARLDTYGSLGNEGENRIRYNVAKVLQPSVRDESQVLLQRLKQYS